MRLIKIAEMFYLYLRRKRNKEH